jgi:hypothetical protein
VIFADRHADRSPDRPGVRAAAGGDADAAPVWLPAYAVITALILYRADRVARLAGDRCPGLLVLLPCLEILVDRLS